MIFLGSLAIQKQKLFIMLWLKVRHVLHLDPSTQQLTKPSLENDCQMLWNPPRHAGSTVWLEFCAWDRWMFGELLCFTECCRPCDSCVIITQTSANEHFSTLWLIAPIWLFRASAPLYPSWSFLLSSDAKTGAWSPLIYCTWHPNKPFPLIKGIRHMPPSEVGWGEHGADVFLQVRWKRWIWNIHLA